jgi:hypothetical protein
MFTRSHEFIRPQFEIDRIFTDRPNAIYRRETGGDFGPSGWAGVLVQPDYSTPERLINAYGEWMVEPLAPDLDNPTTEMTVGFWTGIDGWTNGQILQAGHSASVTGSVPAYSVWFEWYPAQVIRIPNLAINPTDRLAVIVDAAKPPNGFVWMMNQTTGKIFAVEIPPPTNKGVTASIGSSVEWIVEGISADLPNFGAHVFGHLGARSTTRFVDLRTYTLTDITGSGGKQLTESDVVPMASGPPKTSYVVWRGYR